MAGIILDLNDDIKRLQQLRDEVAKLKKQLASIDINVNLNIADDIARKIKSLKDEYYGLLQTIVDAENKVNASVKNINDALSKVVQEQEKFAKSGVQTAANTTEKAQTASVEAQAKAYDDLRKVIEASLGTNEGNARFLAEVNMRIKAVNASMAALNKTINSQGYGATDAQLKQLAKYTQELAELKIQAQDARRELNTGLRINMAGEGSLKQLQNQLLQLQRTWDNMTESTRNSPIGKDFAAALELANKQVSELEQTMGRYQRNVGNYASGFNSLGMSVQQIVRELPSATMGLNMFFLAISNNLPILTDEIKRAVELNKQMKAQNQETIPVWKQLVSSIFSWQTALVVAITAMSMYGKEIVSWIGSLIKGKDATDEIRKSQEQFTEFIKKSNNEWLDSVSKSAGEQISAYQKLVREYNALGNNMNAKKKFIKDNQDAFHQLGFSVTGVTDAENLLVKNTDAVVNALVARAKAAAYEANITAATQEAIKQREEINKTLIERAMNLTGQLYEGDISNLIKGKDYNVTYRTIGTGAYSKIVPAIRLTQSGAEKVAHQEIQAAHKRNEDNLNNIVDQYTQGIKEQTNLVKNALENVGVDEYTGTDNKTDKTDNKKIIEQRKKAQEELNKDLLSLQQQNQDDEIALMQEGTQKKLAEIDNDYKKRIAEIDKQEAEFKKKNKEAGATGLTGGLTSEQQKALQEARDNAAKEQRKQVKETVDEENNTRIATLQDYLKEYGNYEQKRQAITEEYNKKIADATSQVEKTSLQAELEKTLSELDFNEFKDKFNWEDIFGNLGDLTLEQLKNVRTQLRTLLSDNSLSIEDYKTAVEQIDKVNEAIVSEQDKLKDTFSLILPMAEERRKLEMDVAEANARQNELLAEQQELLDGIESKRHSIATTLQNAGLDINASDVNIGNQDAILSQLEGIFGSGSDIYKNVSKSFDELNKSERDLNSTTQKLDKAQADATSAQAKLNKFLSDFGNKLQAVNEIMSLVSSNMQSLPDLFSQLGVDMDSAFGKGITDLANASQNATSAIQDAMSGNFVGALSNGIGAVKGVLSGFNNILGLGIGQGNAKETAEKIERLTESNDYLRKSIDRLTEKMDESAGGRAIGYYEEAKEAQERYNENLRQILDAQMRYTAAHHSNAYYWNLDKDSLKQVNELLGTNLSNEWTDFSKLTAEQMDEIRSNLPDVWEEMINEGKYGDRFREDWENYADQAGKVEELTEQINENLTQTSFDSLRSNFLDTLMDMDADAQDFANDFSEMMQKALLNFAMGDMLDDQLKEWYDSLAETISNNNGKLSQGDIENFRNDWQDMADEWLDMRDTISEITGYKGSSSSTQQSASSKGFETMSQDTGEELNGRMTAIYEAELNIANTTTEQLAVLKAIYGQMGGNIADVASESKQILSTSYIQQNNISFPTAQLDALVAKVEGLDAKVADLVSFGADNRLSMQGVDTYIEDATKNSTKSLSLLSDIKRNTQNL